MKKTKIVCSLGPASKGKKTLREMQKAGMDAARINIAHGTFGDFSEIISNVRAVGEMPIMLDIKGPEVRTVVKSPINIRRGDVIEAGYGRSFPFSFSEDIRNRLSINDRVIISDGYIQFRVKSVRGKGVTLKSLSNGKLENAKSVNVPNKVLSRTPLSKKDLKALTFARKKNVEFIALSITRNAADVRRVRKIVKDEEIGILAKIESAEGMRNIDSIIRESEGVIVARGGLGVDLSPEKVPLAQKHIIRRCNQAGKISITATQMLESMISNPRPTRAETSDVANAILDGSDAVMLTAETSIGAFPVQSVRVMSRIASEIENEVPNRVEIGQYTNISDTVSKSIYDIASSMPLQAIVTITRSGYTARMISRFRVDQPIIAITNNRRVHNRLHLVFGVTPLLANHIPKRHIILAFAQRMREMGLLKTDDTVLFTAGVRTTAKHSSNLIEIHRVDELLKYATRLKMQKSNRIELRK